MNKKQSEVNMFNNKPWNAIGITSREKDKYLISKILSTEKNSSEEIEIELYLYSKLSFCKKAWLGDWGKDKDKDKEIKKERARIKKLKNELTKFEKNIFKSPLRNTSREFDIFKSFETFKNIDQIEIKIKKAINQDFSFSLIHLNDPESISVILSLYNFIFKAKILSMQQLSQLLFPIYTHISTETEMNESVKNISYTFCQYLIGQKRNDFYQLENVYSAMIAMSFKTSLTYNLEENRRTNQRLYALGWSTSSSPIHVFIHEFGHALIKFYSLSRPLRISNNLNINTSKEHLGFITSQMNYHFLKKFNKEGVFCSTKNVLEHAINFMQKKIMPDVEFISDMTIYNFAYWTLVPGFYGRKFNHEKISSEEWFAEGFAYYFLTPPNERNLIWSWWHELFTKELLKFNRL